MPDDRNANHGVSQPTLGWFVLASRWQPTGERGPITKLSKWVTCMIMGHMHDNRLTSGWRNGCSSHRTMPILSHIHVHEKNTQLHRHTQVGGGMDGLFISHANAFSLTYPALNWQVG